MTSSCTAVNNNNNAELYLHGHKRELQHCKSILRITATTTKTTTTKIVMKENQITTIKLLILNCLAFLNRMTRIVLIAY